MGSCIVTRNKFAGVFPANKLPYRIMRPAMVIANLDEDHRPGSHWVCFFLPKDGEGVEFFCSLGQPPLLSYFNRFIARNGGLLAYNTRTIQSEFFDVCGEFSCIYAYSRSIGIPINCFMRDFAKTKKENDRTAVVMFNDYFTCNTHFRRRSLHTVHVQTCSPRCHVGSSRCTGPPHHQQRRSAHSAKNLLQKGGSVSLLTISRDRPPVQQQQQQQLVIRKP